MGHMSTLDTVEEVLLPSQHCAPLSTDLRTQRLVSPTPTMDLGLDLNLSTDCASHAAELTSAPSYCFRRVLGRI